MLFFHQIYKNYNHLLLSFILAHNILLIRRAYTENSFIHTTFQQFISSIPKPMEMSKAFLHSNEDLLSLLCFFFIGQIIICRGEGKKKEARDKREDEYRRQ